MASNLLAFVGAQLDQELKARKADSDVGTRVKHALKRSLAGKRPTLPDVAQELGTSARTLQRKLADARITFQHVVEETRRVPALSRDRALLPEPKRRGIERDRLPPRLRRCQLLLPRLRACS